MIQGLPVLDDPWYFSKYKLVIFLLMCLSLFSVSEQDMDVFALLHMDDVAFRNLFTTEGSRIKF